LTEEQISIIIKRATGEEENKSDEESDHAPVEGIRFHFNHIMF